MKKYISLSIFGVIAFSALIIFYQKGKSTLTSEHEHVTKVFLNAKQVETNIEKDLLKSRNFLLQSYDPIVSNEKNIAKICEELKDPHHGLYKTFSVKIDKAIDEYCFELEEKMERIEVFKSKNAILRNSVYFVERVSSEEFLEKVKPQVILIRNDLIRLSLSYALISTEEAKASLAKSIEQANKYFEKATAGSDEILSLALHAKKILEIKESLDSLTDQIINSQSEKRLEIIRYFYTQNYAKAESTATVYRKILLGLCVIFLIFVIGNILLLLRSAKSLSLLNDSLEERVQERTKELSLSQETIIQQQQALIASAKMSSLGEMAGGIAHEINTPLAVIAMRVEQMQECLADDSLSKEAILKSLNIISITTARIGKIVSGLKFFARDGKALPWAKVRVESVVDETLSFCRERFNNHGVKIEVKNTLDKEAEIECRSVEISQVLLNLLNNAYDAIENDKEKWVRIDIVDRDQLIEISVTDSGPGIPKDIQEKIMQPFFTTKEVGKGTGLGLSISRGVIDSHHGKFYLDCSSGNTCFTLLLPKIQSAEENMKEAV